MKKEEISMPHTPSQPTISNTCTYSIKFSTITSYSFNIFSSYTNIPARNSWPKITKKFPNKGRGATKLIVNYTFWIVRVYVRGPYKEQT